MLFVENLGQGFEKAIKEEETQKAIKVLERYSKSLVMREMQIKSVMACIAFSRSQLYTVFLGLWDPSCIVNRR